MKKFFLSLAILSFALVGGYWLLYSDGTAPIASITQIDKNSQNNVQKQQTASPLSAKVISLKDDASPIVITTPDVETVPSAEQEAIEQLTLEVGKALTWTSHFRDVSSSIGKLRAIKLGNYDLKPGEEAPNLHNEYDALHAEYSLIPIPEEDAEIRTLMEELDFELGSIIGILSEDPTLAELDNANSQRENLRSGIDSLYSLLQAYRL